MYGEDPLGPQAIKRVDTDGVLGEVLDLGEHLRDALWRVQSANITPVATPGGLQVVGVDGLQTGGELARRALVDATAPIQALREAPPARTEKTTLLLTSYSGEDPVVLEAFSAGQDAQRVVLTTGGKLAGLARSEGVPVVPLPGGFPQPVLAIGYPLVVSLELARLGGFGVNSAQAVEFAAAHVARLARQWGPDSEQGSPAKEVALAAVQQRDPDWLMSPVEAGEGPLQQIVTRLLLDNLVDLYTQVLQTTA